jgi:hypothetical protein
MGQGCRLGQLLPLRSMWLQTRVRFAGMEWLVTFAYFSERADVYVVTAETADEARARVADLTPDTDAGWLRREVLEEAQVAQVADGLHVVQYAEH